MRIFLLFFAVIFMGACAGPTLIRQSADGGTYVTATFVEANAPRVQRSLAAPVCPQGTKETGSMSGFASHEATLDTGRGRNDGYTDGYGYQRRSPPVHVQQRVGGRKDFVCVPDIEEGK